ncbi:MAG: hypothetical protein ACI8WP_001465 [Flavobacteriaceae bacterium]
MIAIYSAQLAPTAPAPTTVIFMIYVVFKLKFLLLKSTHQLEQSQRLAMKAFDA